MSDTAETDVSDTLSPRVSALRGQTSGAMVLTGAGLGWVMLGLSALGDVPLATLSFLVLPAGLFLAGLSLGRGARGLPDTPWPPRVARVFWQTVAGENIGIVLTLLAAMLLHRPDIIAPLIAVAVGLHFLPLARAFVRSLYYGTGALLCLVGLATLAFVPLSFGPHHVPARLLAAGLGAGATLWGTALLLLIQGRATLREFLGGRSTCSALTPGGRRMRTATRTCWSSCRTATSRRWSAGYRRGCVCGICTSQKTSWWRRRRRWAGPAVSMPRWRARF